MLRPDVNYLNIFKALIYCKLLLDDALMLFFCRKLLLLCVRPIGRVLPVRLSLVCAVKIKLKK